MNGTLHGFSIGLNWVPIRIFKNLSGRTPCPKWDYDTQSKSDIRSSWQGQGCCPVFTRNLNNGLISIRFLGKMETYVSMSVLAIVGVSLMSMWVLCMSEEAHFGLRGWPSSNRIRARARNRVAIQRICTELTVRRDQRLGEHQRRTA